MSAEQGKRKIANEKVCQELAEQMLSLALRAGADGAEVLVRDGAELEVKLRMGEPELVKEAGSRGLGLRVLKENRAAVTYTSDFDAQAMQSFAEESVALCRLSEPEPLAALPDREEVARAIPDLDLWDESVLSIDVAEAMRWAKAGEQAALKFDPRVVNSEGSIFGRGVGAVAFATSVGFSAAYRGSNVSFVVEPVCDDREGKKRNGYHYTSNRFVAGLQAAEEVGIEAARRTVAKLGSRKVATCQVPAVFSPEAGRSLLGQFAGLISGGAVWRKNSYLAEREGTAVASPLVSIVDDPLLPRAPGSRPFDGEGLAVRPNVVVSEGVLRTFLCDVYSARKLGRKSTASAGRGLGGGPHVATSNFILRPGKSSAKDAADVAQGLYVTALMGFGFNPVTGDFSQGAAGFWIENGEQTFPVSEVTISVNFDDLWKGIDAVADDIDTRSSVQCPTFRVAKVTVAGT
jgi:PmbA protein